MVSLSIAKSRTSARTEKYVARKGDITNPSWKGLAVTVASSGNGMQWGSVGAPSTFLAYGQALAGGSTQLYLDSNNATKSFSFAPSFLLGMTARIMRISNGLLTTVRTSPITAVGVDAWSQLAGGKAITTTSFEYRLNSYVDLSKTYTFGVAQITAGGQVGPISKVDVTVTGPTYTSLDEGVAATTGNSINITSRDPALPAITGLTAVVRSGSTHNIQLSWTGTGTNSYAVFINWDGNSDRFNFESSVTIGAGASILPGDFWVIESDPILTIQPSDISSRVKGLTLFKKFASLIIYDNPINEPGKITWQWTPYDGGFPKPDASYSDYFFQINGATGVKAAAQRFFYSGTNQTTLDVLVPGRTYRAEVVAAGSVNMNATFTVDDWAGSQVLALTTAPQTFTIDFSVPSVLTSASARSWKLEAQTTNASLKILSVKVWDTTSAGRQLWQPAPQGATIRDHQMVKTDFLLLTLDGMTSRDGSGVSGGATFDTLWRDCLTAGAFPHHQVEWLYPDQFYTDLATFFFAPAASNEPLALKREAMGYGPLNTQFGRHYFEDGNEKWNSIMLSTFLSATDSVTSKVYTSGEIASIFSAHRRSLFEASPYWPATNKPIEFTGGKLGDTGFTVGQVSLFPAANIASVANYTSGTDVNKIILTDTAERWNDILTIGDVDHKAKLTSLRNALDGTGVRPSIYEAGPGYQFDGLNGAVVTLSDNIVQEAMCKSIGGTTAMMNSIGVSASMGYEQYNFFTWGSGARWAAVRRRVDGGGLYRVASYIKTFWETMGECRLSTPIPFIERVREIPTYNTSGVFVANRPAPLARVYHWESITYPGRVALLYVNTNINLDAFGSGHPSYSAGKTGEATIRYHTGFLDTATPFKLMDNSGNFRNHDSSKTGFRLNVVNNVIDGYVADPLSVDLTVSLDNFTVDSTALREVSLLGGNCRVEFYDNAV